ncbi:aminodeoxychorismate lyase [gut metagenome]|uniref:Aminodeoxychorismate lyase n=1 Tax=gut metagenome TaxID=749906 RepID=J9FAM9_9ZZZZ
MHTGCYIIHSQDNVYQLFNRLYKGFQTPVNLTIGNVRTLGHLSKSIGKQLMIDSAEIAEKMNDTLFQHQLGYRKETLPCLFISNTYEVYWNISLEKLFQRFQKEHDRFWNQERKTKANSIGMTPEEVCTLASIVEEETNNQAENLW